MAGKVTMTDIAKELGVSTVAVSKALSAKKGISEGLREKILKTAREMGYDRKSPKDCEKKTLRLGVIVAERFLAEVRSFYWWLYQEITQVAKKKQHFTFLEVVSERAENGCEMPELLKPHRLDALIVMGAFSKEYMETLDRVAVIPLLALDSAYENIRADAVNTDNLEGGYRMTEYLIRAGYQKIGYVGTLRVTPSIDERYLGYYKAMLFHGLEMRPEWLIRDRMEENGQVDAEVCFALPEAEHMPDAFFCNSDHSAMILIEKLKQKGYRIPEDISVAGFDHYLSETAGSRDLTTYEVNTKEMAEEVVELLERRVEKRQSPFRTMTVRGRLIAGDTVKDKMGDL